MSRESGPVVEMVEKPFWMSKKLIAYVCTLVALLVSVAIKAPPEVIQRISDAIMFGFPVLIGGQAYVDGKKAQWGPPVVLDTRDLIVEDPRRG